MPRNLCLGLFAIVVLAGPIYIFKSGVPQPADMLMAFLVAVVLTGFVIKPPVHRDLYLVGALFLGHATIINLFWWTQDKAISFLLSPVYFAFNFLAFIVIVSLMREFRERFVVVCQAAFAAAIILEVVVMVAWPSYSKSGERSIGTFNNPNQLGYWALLMGASLLVLKRDQRLNLLDMALLGGAGMVVMHSLSKAALLSFAVLLSIALVCQRPTRLVKAALIALVLMSMTVAVADPALVGRFFSEGMASKVANRLDDIGKQKDDSLAGRGYDRIWHDPEYLVLGAGEGASYRFSDSQINAYQDQKELHSTLGTVLFSYGIVGFALFAFLMRLVFRPAPWAHFLYSVPIWMYGFTHQGLRFTAFWMFFALVFGMAHYVDATRPAENARRRIPAIDLRSPSMSPRLMAASRRR